jgi:hypothetical protein
MADQRTGTSPPCTERWICTVGQTETASPRVRTTLGDWWPPLKSADRGERAARLNQASAGFYPAECQHPPVWKPEVLVAITAAFAGCSPRVAAQIRHSGSSRVGWLTRRWRRASRSDQPEAEQRRRAAAVYSRVNWNWREGSPPARGVPPRFARRGLTCLQHGGCSRSRNGKGEALERSRCAETPQSHPCQRCRRGFLTPTPEFGRLRLVRPPSVEFDHLKDGHVAAR